MSIIRSRRPEKWDMRYIHLAEHYSTWSKDPSTTCGAVIVDCDRNQVSEGYNGFPRGMDDDPTIYEDREKKYEKILHCEMNAVLTAATSVVGCTLYTWPLLSCPRCAVHMIQVGIIRCVAPTVPEDKLDRWAPQIGRTKAFFREAGVSYTEVDLRRNLVVDEFESLEEIPEILRDKLTS